MRRFASAGFYTQARTGVTSVMFGLKWLGCSNIINCLNPQIHGLNF